MLCIGYAESATPRREPLTRLASNDASHPLPQGERQEAGFDLAQFDLVGDLMREIDAADGEHHFGREFFVAFEAAGFDGLAHRFLDLSLRGDADLLEKPAQAGVEDVFVHDGLLIAQGAYTGNGVARNLINSRLTPHPRHCEKQSDEAIHLSFSRSPSSGARIRATRWLVNDGYPSPISGRASS